MTVAIAEWALCGNKECWAATANKCHLCFGRFYRCCSWICTRNRQGIRYIIYIVYVYINLFVKRQREREREIKRTRERERERCTDRDIQDTFTISFNLRPWETPWRITNQQSRPHHSSFDNNFEDAATRLFVEPWHVPQVGTPVAVDIGWTVDPGRADSDREIVKNVRGGNHLPTALPHKSRVRCSTCSKTPDHHIPVQESPNQITLLD